MKTKTFLEASTLGMVLSVAAALFSGCETTDSSKPPPTANSNTATTPPPASASAPVAGAPSVGATKTFAEQYLADDGRTIHIGRATPDNGGWRFKEPHLDKVWIAEGFNFTGYDIIYIAPTVSTAKIHDDEVATQDLAKENMVIELKRSLAAKGLFPHVVTNESEIKPNTRVLRIETTIVEYAKGGGAARYFVGLYGGGQPRFRLQGKMTDGDKTVFSFEARRSGVSAGARLSGVAMKDEDIQLEDIRSFVLDLNDFMAAVAGKYPPRG